MKEHKTYTTAGAFRRALEERLKKTSQTDQTDINRLRRQVSFDRLLARLFRDDSVPWVLKGGYALELRFKTARSTVDIDLTMGRMEDATDSSDVNRVVREILQAAASLPLGDWFEYTIGSPMMDITAAPYGGARYPVEVRMDGRISESSTSTQASEILSFIRWRSSKRAIGSHSQESNGRKCD